MDGCIKDLSNFVVDIGKNCSPLLPRSAGENKRKPGYLPTKAYKSKTKKLLCVFDIPKGEIFMYCTS
jgi:hypothetical protein